MDAIHEQFAGLLRSYGATVPTGAHWSGNMSPDGLGQIIMRYQGIIICRVLRPGFGERDANHEIRNIVRRLAPTWWPHLFNLDSAPAHANASQAVIDSYNAAFADASSATRKNHP